MKKRHILAFISGIIAVLTLAACTHFVTKPTSVVPANASLLVSAAASLQEALQEIQPIFQKSQAQTSVNYNFGASGALQQQIEQGSPVDVFISAATKQMNALQKKDLILTDTLHQLLTNSLVLIVSNHSNLQIKDFTQLADSNVEKIAVGEFKSVPVGQYTEEMFKNLKIFDQVKPKLVFGNSVRNVLAAVESGDVDAGIVYKTDAKISNQVKVIATVPKNLHSPIIYPIAVLKNSRNPETAKDYVKFLVSDAAATTVFQKYGFGIASQPSKS